MGEGLQSTGSMEKVAKVAGSLTVDEAPGLYSPPA